MSGKFESDPRSVQDFVDNVEFQLANVRGWISAGKSVNAAIKAEFLAEAAVALRCRLDREPEVVQYREKLAEEVAANRKAKGGAK